MSRPDFSLHLMGPVLELPQINGTPHSSVRSAIIPPMKIFRFSKNTFFLSLLVDDWLFLFLFSFFFFL